jgi:hypothetical protein
VYDCCGIYVWITVLLHDVRACVHGQNGTLGSDVTFDRDPEICHMTALDATGMTTSD